MNKNLKCYFLNTCQLGQFFFNWNIVFFRYLDDFSIIIIIGASLKIKSLILTWGLNILINSFRLTPIVNLKIGFVAVDEVFYNLISFFRSIWRSMEVEQLRASCAASTRSWTSSSTSRPSSQSPERRSRSGWSSSEETRSSCSKQRIGSETESGSTTIQSFCFRQTFYLFSDHLCTNLKYLGNVFSDKCSILMKINDWHLNCIWKFKISRFNLWIQ